ncbi:MAG: efflux RND transporter permease subunit [Gemmatimonadaceae bacterium]|nr:efflux RND transporter permease subunit [Gemmatimonadaceae bacterium]
MIHAAVHRPAVVLASCLAMLFAGAIAFTRLPLATKTTVELPRLSIAAAWPGSSPEVIETYLTSPIESAVLGVRGVRQVNSTSYDDFATLTVELEERADVPMARLAILERLELLRSELPAGVNPPSVSNYVPEDLQESPLLSLTVSGPYTTGALQRLLDERVTPRLATVAGVAGVQLRGGADLGVSVSYDATRLRQMGLPPERLTQAIQGARIVEALGDLTTEAQVRSVVLRDQPAALDSLAALPVMGAGGRVFRLGELASIRAEEDERGRFYRIDGTSAVSVDVSRHPGADAIQTAAALRRVIAELTRVMPPGIRLRVVNDESVALAKELRDLTTRAAIACGAVLLVLALLLRRWRAVAVVMGAAAVALAATALTLYVLDIPANLLTLAGLGMGVGILVQNAIVVVDRLARAPDTPDGRAAATRRIAPAVVGSSLTTAVVFFPFLYLQGNARAAFVPFALAFVIALVWSVITALLVVPALGAGIAVRVAAREAPWPRVRHLYTAVVARTLRWRWATLLLTVSTLAGLTWVFVVKVPRASWGGWGERRTTLTASLSFPRGSDPAGLDRAMREFERIVVGRPEVEQVRTQSSGRTSAQMSVVFTRDGAFTVAPMELQELLTQRAVLIGGAQVGVYGDGPGFSSGGGGGSFATFRLQVKGFSYDGVSRVAEDFKRRLERITRVQEVRITSGNAWGAGERGYQVVLDPDRAALTRYRLNAAMFAQAVAREVRGPVGGTRLEIGGEELPVTVKASGARERSIEELQDALVPNVIGAPVRVRDVAAVDAREALSTVVREDQQYVRQVSYDFRGPAKLARRTHNAFVKSLSVPAGYSIKDLSDGRFDQDDESARGLWLVFTIGLCLVILSVAIVFDSVWGAAMVLLSVPLALAGVVVAFWAADAAFTREAAVGVILVVGLAVHQGILFVDAVLEKWRTFGRLRAGHVVFAALDRAPMIVVITLASLASLVPLSVGTSTQTMFGAIALATAGGTMSATLGVLFVLPAMIKPLRIALKG